MYEKSAPASYTGKGKERRRGRESGHNWCGKGDGMSKEDRSAFHFPGAVSLELISHEERETEVNACLA